MPVVTFLGRVMPEASPFSLWFADPVNWYPFDIPMKFSAKIDQAKIRVDCEVTSYRQEHMALIYKAAYDLVRAHVDLVSFSEGFGWSISLDTFIDPDGISVPLYIRVPILAAECTAFKMNFSKPEESPDFMAAAKAVITEPALLYALNDLTETLTRPHIAPINCGRVLDGLRKTVAPTDKPPQGWAILRQIVNVDAQYLKWVMEISKNPRHGDRSYIEGTKITEAVRRCWAVINRFIEYRKRGNTPLPISDFPTLHG